MFNWVDDIMARQHDENGEEWDEEEFLDHVEGICARDCYWCCNEPED